MAAVSNAREAGDAGGGDSADGVLGSESLEIFWVEEYQPPPGPAPGPLPPPGPLPGEPGSTPLLRTLPRPGPSASSVRLRESEMFSAVIAKGERKLGVDINYHDHMTLLVTRVNAGPCDDYNNSVDAVKVGPGDRVIGVNGVMGDTRQMVDACKEAAELRLTVRRCEEITVRLQRLRPEQHLGLSLEACDTMSLVVTHVADDVRSLVAEHNQSCPPEFVIEKDFRVIGINGARDSARAVLDALQEGGLNWELIFRQVWPR